MGSASRVAGMCLCSWVAILLIVPSDCGFSLLKTVPTASAYGSCTGRAHYETHCPEIKRIQCPRMVNFSDCVVCSCWDYIAILAVVSSQHYKCIEPAMDRNLLYGDRWSLLPCSNTWLVSGILYNYEQSGQANKTSWCTSFYLHIGSHICTRWCVLPVLCVSSWCLTAITLPLHRCLTLIMCLCTIQSRYLLQALRPLLMSWTLDYQTKNGVELLAMLILQIVALFVMEDMGVTVWWNALNG